MKHDMNQYLILRQLQLLSHKTSQSGCDVYYVSVACFWLSRQKLSSRKKFLCIWRYKPIQRFGKLTGQPAEWNLHYWGLYGCCWGSLGTWSPFFTLLALDSAQAGLPFVHQMKLPQILGWWDVVTRHQYRPLSSITSFITIISYLPSLTLVSLHLPFIPNSCQSSLLQVVL